MSAKIQVVPVECLKDNLSYLILNSASKTAIAIDPGEAPPFFRALETIRQTTGHTYTLAAAMTTHHHYDHVDGLPDFPDVPTWSSVGDEGRIPAAGSGKQFSFERGRKYRWSELLSPNSALSVDNESGIESSIEIEAIEIPGHTQGQIAIRVRGFDQSTNQIESHLFVGDTLFSFGCGRCVEGTPEQLFSSLQKLKSLPPETWLHFGHEYSKRNLAFWRKGMTEFPEQSQSVVDSDAISRFEALVQAPGFRFRKAPTLGDEIGVNPFLRIANVKLFTFWRAQRDVY